MPDYNIYIRTSGTTTNQNPTKPWESGGETNTMTQPWYEEMSGTPTETESGGFLKQIAMGITTKANPYVAAIIAGYYLVTKAVRKAVGTVNTILERNTGDYRFSTDWNNAWTAHDAVFKPISTAYQYYTFYDEIRIQNKRQEQERQLIGDAFTNGLKRK